MRWSIWILFCIYLLVLDTSRWIYVVGDDDEAAVVVAVAAATHDDDDWMNCHEIEPNIVFFLLFFTFYYCSFWCTANRIERLKRNQLQLLDDCPNDTMITFTLHFFCDRLFIYIHIYSYWTREEKKQAVWVCIWWYWIMMDARASLLYSLEYTLLCACVCVIECTLQQSIIKFLLFSQ